MVQSIRIESKINNYCKIENFINSIFNEYKFSRKLYCKIYISVNEAVTNAINHGNSNLENKYVTLEFSDNSDHYQFLITDEGKGFDYNNLIDPTEEINIKKESGRGIFIMKKYSDDISFMDNGSKVKLIFYKQVD